MPGPPDGIYNEQTQQGPPDGVFDPSTLDVKDGKLTRTHPSKMLDDEIATRILGMNPHDWAKAKASARYRFLSQGGRKQVLADSFTDPEGWWGSYVVGKNKDTPGTSINRAVQSGMAGGNRALLSFGQLVGKLSSKLPGQSGGEFLDEALLRANQANQNINQGRQPAKESFDPANMVGQGAVGNALMRGNPSGGLTARAAVNVPRNALEGYVTTPGTGGERMASAGLSAVLGNVAEIAPGLASKGAQKLLGVTNTMKSRAARREELLKALNERFGTNLELTAGQASGSPRMIGAEELAVHLPGGLTKTRIKGNEETIKMVRANAEQARSAVDATGYGGITDLVDAVGAGDKNAARILRDYIDQAGADNAKIISASKEANLWPLQQRNKSLWDTFKKEGDTIGPINMGTEVPRLNAFVSNLERILGKESPTTGTARAVAEDIGAAQKDIFRKKLPESVYAPGRVEYESGSIGEFLSGGLGEQKMLPVAGSVDEVVNPGGSVFQHYGSRGFPPGGTEIQGASRWERPPSNPAALNAGNIHESISRLKSAAANLRETNPRGAAELDQIVTGMDSLLERAASGNPSVRASLDAAKMDTKDVLRPVQNAGRALSYPGSDGGTVDIPQAIALEGKGKAAVRSMAADQALASGQSFGRQSREVLDSDKTASVLENRALDQFYSGDDASIRNALIEILRASHENGQILSNPLSGNRLVPIEILNALKKAGGAAAGATIGGAALGAPGALITPFLPGPVARGLFASKGGKEFLLGNPWERRLPGGRAPGSLGLVAGQQVFGGADPEYYEEYQ